MTFGNIIRLSRLAHLAAALALIAFAIPASAATPIFPTGSRVGLIPPAGMVLSRTFSGFEDPDKKAVILISSMPAAAYAEIETSLADEVLKKQQFTVDKREPIEFSFGKGFLISGKVVIENQRYRKWLLAGAGENVTALVSVQVAEADQTYSDATVRTALQSLVVRSSVPDAEWLSLVPFTIGDLAGFHIDEVAPGRGLSLVDVRTDPGSTSQPRTFNARFIIAAREGGPTDNNHADFARLALGSIAGVKDIHLTMNEPLRLGGQSGFQTMAEAKDANTGAPLMVVQWLRFGSGGFLQMLGVARSDDWVPMLTRLRTVRDSINVR